MEFCHISGISLAYLYNAVQKEGAIPLEWPDMDRIIDFHSEEHIFIGGKPKDVNESVRKLCLMMGYAPQSFAVKGRRVLENVVSMKGPRSLEETTVVSKVFWDRYCNNGSVDLSIAKIETLLNEVAGSATSGHRIKARTNDALKKKWQKTKTLSPLQLLATLCERLSNEEPLLMFNYFGMHKRCMDLLRLLKATLRDTLPENIQHDHQLAIVVQNIFIDAMASGARADKWDRPPDRATTRSLLTRR